MLTRITPVVMQPCAAMIYVSSSTMNAMGETTCRDERGQVLIKASPLPWNKLNREPLKSNVLEMENEDIVAWCYVTAKSMSDSPNKA